MEEEGTRAVGETRRMTPIILDPIGNTPMVRLRRIGAGLPVELLGKCGSPC